MRKPKYKKPMYVRKRFSFKKFLTVFLVTSISVVGTVAVVFQLKNHHTHSFSSEWSKDAAYHWQACSECDETRNKAEHKWNAGVITSPPTEAIEGARTFTCDDCGHTRVESVPKLEAGHVHTYNQQITADNFLKSPATCTAKALYFYSCTCGAASTETFEHGDFANHIYSTLWSYNDTHHWHSATCEHTEKKSNYTEHDWDAGTVTKEPTAATAGIKVFVCASCGKIRSEDIPATGEVHTHVFNRTNTANEYLDSEATCTERATYFYSCLCGLKGTATFEYGTVKEHIFTVYTKNNDATCTQDGTKTAICDVCRIATDKIDDIGSATGHKYSREWTSNEFYHWHASTCGHENEISDITSHSWDSGEITKEPTTTTDGEKTYTCQICEKSKVENIGTSDHTHTYEPEYSSDDNYHWYATTCEHASEVKDKAPHRWNEGVVDSEPTVYDEGVKLYTCRDCEHTKEEAIAKKPSFTVVFYDSDNRIILNKKYELTSSQIEITVPNITAESGTKFDKWVDISSKKSITEINFAFAQENAVYQFKPTFIKVHEIVFTDYEGNQIGMLSVDDGTVLGESDLPAIPGREGYNCNWDKNSILGIPIKESKVYSPIYSVQTFEVKFLDLKGGNEIYTETVEYGSFAMIPKYEPYWLPSEEYEEFGRLYGFTGWKSSATDTFIDNISGNKITGITRDLTVYATYEKIIEQPVVAVHINGTTVTMSLCMPESASLYSINLSIGWKLAEEEGRACEINSASIVETTLLNADRCSNSNSQLHLDRNEWLTYNNKTQTLDFVWGCGNGHSIRVEYNLITIEFGTQSAIVTEEIFTLLENSSIIYRIGNSEVQQSPIAIWFY